MLKQETPILGALTGEPCPPHANAAALAGATAPVEGVPAKNLDAEAITPAASGEVRPAGGPLDEVPHDAAIGWLVEALVEGGDA